MTDIRYPNITAKDEAGQLLQVKSYLHQLVDQLNYSMKTVSAGGTGSMAYGTGSAGGGAEGSTDASAQATFNSLKGLIIKSADIVNAYYEAINNRLSGIYVAQSEFGTFSEQTTQDIEANSTAISQQFSNIQKILTDLENVEHTLIEVNAHIKSGLLYYDEDGVPIYGVEVGQRTQVDGVETFNQYARFTADKLSFYDNNGNEVAYISDKKLYITHVEVTGSFSLGGFVDTVLAGKGVVTRWVAGGEG